MDETLEKDRERQARWFRDLAKAERVAASWARRRGAAPDVWQYHHARASAFHDASAAITGLAYKAPPPVVIDDIPPSFEFAPDAPGIADDDARRLNRVIEYGGESMSIPAWARKIGMGPAALRDRFARGWTVERALTTPVEPKRGRLRDRVPSDKVLAPRG